MDLLLDALEEGDGLAAVDDAVIVRQRHVLLCVCVSVRERERERERGGGAGREEETKTHAKHTHTRKRAETRLGRISILHTVAA